MTMIGATTIVSLHAIPSAQHSTDHHPRKYTVARKNDAIISSVRCDT